MSLLLWFLLALASPSGYTKRVKVRVAWPDFPSSFVVTDSTSYPESIAVELHCGGFELLSYSLKSLFRTVLVYTPQIDTATLDEAGGTWELSERQLKSQILTDILPIAKSMLKDTLRNVSLSPNTLTIPYEPLSGAEADVIFTSQVDFGKKPNLKLIDEVLLTPEKVTLYGAQSKIDSLRNSGALFARTDTVSVRIGDPGMVRTSIALIPPKGTVAEPDSVLVTMTTEELTSRTYMANSIAIEGLDPRYELHLLPARVRVTYLVTKTSAQDQALPDIRLYVDASKVVRLQTKSLPVKVKDFPKEVELIQLEPDRVNFVLEEKNVSARPQ